MGEDSNASGGQTGSLVPLCPENFGKPFVVPEGQTAFASRSELSIDQIVVTNSSGNVVSSSSAREDTATVITTDEALEAGTYTIAYNCSPSSARIERELTVVEAAPLPTELGEVTFVEQPLTQCSLVNSVTLEWQPSPEFLPYLNLTELSLVADGMDLGVIPTPGPFMLGPNGLVTVDVPLCRGGEFCGPATAIYELTAHIVGFESEWTSSEVEVNQTCLTDRRMSETSCNLTASVPGTRPASWSVVGILVGLGVLTRRKFRASDTHSRRAPSDASR